MIHALAKVYRATSFPRATSHTSSFWRGPRSSIGSAIGNYGLGAYLGLATAPEYLLNLRLGHDSV